MARVSLKSALCSGLQASELHLNVPDAASKAVGIVRRRTMEDSLEGQSPLRLSYRHEAAARRLSQTCGAVHDYHLEVMARPGARLNIRLSRACAPLQKHHTRKGSGHLCLRRAKLCAGRGD